MKLVDEIRRDNLELLIAEMGSLKAVAEHGHTSEIYLSQIKNRAIDRKTGKPRSMGAKVARRLEAGKSHGWMDEQHQDDAMSRYVTQIKSLLTAIPADRQSTAVLEVVQVLAQFLPGGSRQR